MRWLARESAWWVAVLVAVGVAAQLDVAAKTVEVPAQETDLETALARASGGDTLLVAPGRYVGTFRIPDGVSLIALAGPDSTVLDAGGKGRVIVFEAEAEFGTLLDGFTITGGRLSGDEEDGAGILCARYASPRINNNIITGNRALGADARGGGIACLGGANPVVSNNRVGDNAAAWGGGIYIGKRSGWPSSPIIHSNTIAGNHARLGGGGIAVTHTSEPHIASNVIRGNSSSASGGGGFHIARAQPVIEENVIWANHDSAGVAAAICLVDYAAPIVTRNIIARNTGAPAILCVPQFIERQVFTCNDVWANETDFGPGCAVFPGNITVDPRFCDPDAGEFGLRPSSPCLLVPDCGRVGAFGIGCEEPAAGAAAVDDSTTLDR